MRIIVPLPAGGAADAHMRAIALEMEKLVQQPVVVDNRPGGQFVVGIHALLQAPPDAHTFMHIYNGVVATQVVHKQFDLLRQTKPVTMVSENAILLAVGGKSPHRSFQDLLNTLRANPGKTNFGVPGSGGVEHLKIAEMETAFGFKATMVPYKGGPDMVNALVAGDVDAALVPGLFGLQFAPTGQLRVLATPGASRFAGFPEAPTLTELGFKSDPLAYWAGVVVRGDTPDPSVQRLQAEIVRASATKSVRDAAAATAGSVKLSEPRELQTLIESDMRWMAASASRLKLTS
ncbi:MAG: tripartite tricarboxylate transporter substrate binding protein [Gammaproteobacteria bacterium]|nr:tripartite tricarboxylate transporter substrate binding protein [Gammaproteobacteria bacterium]MBU1441598.1 tripartite tricarboxylate transporter substrate binding protein [Gammaproteobacteria bacterium]MBU2286600.1 tripartite tricarboxylate transporter substrate binding protein [Gammaproteobacteria bacterium]